MSYQEETDEAIRAAGIMVMILLGCMILAIGCGVGWIMCQYAQSEALTKPVTPVIVGE